MKFKEVDFWCEFPNKLNWTLTKKILKKYKINPRIFIAVKTKKEFLNYKKKIKMNLIPWVLLPKTHGYFFSGFSKKADISHLNQFRNMKIFIDIEPPMPRIPLITFPLFYLWLFLHKAKNYPFLKKEIAKLSETNKVLVSEFPFPHSIFRKLGIYINPKKQYYHNNVIKVLGAYTTMFPFLKILFRPFIYHEVRRKIEENPNTYLAVGLMGPGIVGIEGSYKNEKEFKKDLQKFYRLKVKKIIIYSLEGLIKRKDKEKFFELISKL